MSSTLPIPPRWLYCPRKGNVIVKKFLPFKTPLDSRYDRQVPEECRFGVDMLFLSLKASKLKMGLFVDLTNTSRFYDKTKVEHFNSKYLKLQCRGHGECPSQDQTTAFIEVCDSFIRMNPLHIIGVHCTHGFNRTGFLIVAYLVEKMDWSVDAAVRCFAQVRPPGIYKQDYLEELFRRYSDPEDTPPAPPLPDWCTESNDGDRDDDGNLIQDGEETQRNKRRRREIVKKNAQFMDGMVPSVMMVSTQPRCSQVQVRIQEMCKWKGSGFPGSQPVSMDMKNIAFLGQKPYKVSWKADGTRYMMLIDGINEVYMVDRDNIVFHVPNLFFPKRKDLNAHLTQTLVDGEMIIDKVEGKPVPRYLIYDIVKFEGQDVGGADFDRRLLCINKEIVNPRYEKIRIGRLDKAREPFSVRSKPFWDLAAAQSLLEGKFSKEVSHETDGLIFQPAVTAYICGRCQDNLKWKPPDLNSVDFKLRVIIEEKPGMLRETKGYLFVGGLDVPFSEIKLTKDLKNLDNKIIECSFDMQSKQWKLMRQRTDKSFPNAHSTAMGVCNSIQNPVTKARLFGFIEHERWRPHPKAGHPAPHPGQAPPHMDRSHMPVLQPPSSIESSSEDRDLMPPPRKLPRVAKH